MSLPVEPQSIAVRNERSLALFILSAFLLVGALVATRSPTVYVDEPQFTDPGANLALGHGFTSTMWGQPRDALWTGNTPLYPGMLGAWLKIFGFGLFQARILNPLLTACGGLLIWAGLRKSKLIEQSKLRLLCLALVLSGSASTLTFRTIRPDALMFLLCATVFFAGCLPAKKGWRNALAALSAALLPAAGIAMLPYFGAVAILVLAVYRKRHLPVLVATGIGMLTGLGCLALFYHHHLALQTFLQQVLTLTALGAPQVNHASFLYTRIFGAGPGHDNLFTSFFGNPLVTLHPTTLFDYSAAMLFLVLCILGATCWRRFNNDGRRFFILAVAITLLVPPLMHLTGHYRAYYRWMTYVPLCIAAPKLLEIGMKAGVATRARKAAWLIIGVSILLGVPARTGVAVLTWQKRSPKPLQEVARNVGREDDTLVCDPEVYFALRARVKLLYAYRLSARGDFSLIPDLPTNQVSLLCLVPEDLGPVTNRIGGEWKKVPLEGVPGAEALAKTRYAVDFYRRADDIPSR